MKKLPFKAIIFAISIFSFLFQACEKNLDSDSNENREKLAVDSYYDIQVSKLADSLFISMSDPKFCQYLKNQFLDKADGDFDLMLNKIDIRSTEFKAEAIKNCITFKDSKLKNGGLEKQLLEIYPQLQFAMPVNIDKWDGKSKVYIAYVPSDFQERVTKKVPAISPDGNKVLLDVDKEPDFPVIVINRNERSDKEGQILPRYQKKKANLDISKLKSGANTFPTFTSTALVNTMAIQLQWTFSMPSEFSGYNNKIGIFRDDLSGSGYVKIAEVGSYTGVYNDVAVLPGRTYSYYLALLVDFSGYGSYYSTYSSSTITATAATVPDFTDNFKVDNRAPNSMFLTWNIKNQSNWNSLTIERYTPYAGSVVVANLPVYSTNFEDVLTNPNPSYGVKYTYTIKVKNTNSGANQSFYYQEFLSSRYDNQFITLKGLHFRSFDDLRYYESWIQGDPEIDMCMVYINSSSTPTNIISDIRIGCQQTSHTSLNWQIARWQKEVYGKVFTITLNEYDGGSTGESTVNLNSEVKTPLPGGVTTELKTTTTTKVPSRNLDDFIGTGYLYFIDNPTLQQVSIGPKVYLDFASTQ